MAPSSLFEVQKDGSVTIVKFTEKHLNETNVQQIGETLTSLAGELGKGELHLDFTDVEYLSTIVMAKLLNMHKRVTRDGGRFVLKNLHELNELFKVTRLDELMNIEPDKESLKKD